MKAGFVYAPRYYVAESEKANGHTLTVAAANTGTLTEGSVWPTVLPQRHYYEPAGGAPSLAVGAAAGTGATIAGIPVTLNDGLLPLKLVTGTSPSTGTIVTITFHVTYPANTLMVFPTPLDGISGGLQLMSPQTTNTPSAMVVTCNVAPAASTTYRFALKIVGLY
jgi:hypothetical protein